MSPGSASARTSIGWCPEPQCPPCRAVGAAVPPAHPTVVTAVRMGVLPQCSRTPFITLAGICSGLGCVAGPHDAAGEAGSSSLCSPIITRPPPPRPPQALWLCPQREEPGSGDRRVQTNFYYHSAERVWARSLGGKRHRTRERQLEKRSRDGLPGGAGARGCGRLSRGSEAGSVLSLHPTHTCGTLTHSQTVLSSRLRIRGDVGGTVPTRTVLLKTDALGRECSRVVPRAGLPSGTTSVSAAPGGQGGTWDPLPLPGHFLT